MVTLVHTESDFCRFYSYSSVRGQYPSRVSKTTFHQMIVYIVEPMAGASRDFNGSVVGSRFLMFVLPRLPLLTKR